MKQRLSLSPLFLLRGLCTQLHASPEAAAPIRQQHTHTHYLNSSSLPPPATPTYLPPFLSLSHGEPHHTPTPSLLCISFSCAPHYSATIAAARKQIAAVLMLPLCSAWLAFETILQKAASDFSSSSIFHHAGSSTAPQHCSMTPPQLKPPPDSRPPPKKCNILPLIL